MENTTPETPAGTIPPADGQIVQENQNTPAEKAPSPEQAFQDVWGALDDRAKLNEMMKPAEKPETPPQAAEPPKEPVPEAKAQPTPPVTPPEPQAQQPEPPKEPAAVAPVKPPQTPEEELAHRIKSDLGRVPALQREIAELKAQLALKPASPKDGSAPSPPKAKFPTSERFKKLRDQDPELADTIAEAIVSSRDEVLQEQQALQHRVEQSNHQQYLQRQSEIIQHYVPHIGDIVNGEEWKEFVATSSPGIRNLCNSSEAQECLLAVNLYESWLPTRYPEKAKKPEAPAPAQAQTVPAQTPPPAKEPSPQAQKVEQKREQKLGKGEVPSQQQTGARGPQDMESNFNYWWNKIER